MKDTPLPLTVSAMTAFGRSAIRVQPRNVRSIAATSWPSHRSTCQPNARSFASRSPRSLTSLHPGVGLNLVVVDDGDDLAEVRVDADASDSQNCPSCSSPSPVSTNIRRGLLQSRLARAMPFAFEIPMPSEPVFACTYGVSTCG